MLRVVLKICLALIILTVAALSVFWFARPADVVFDQQKASVPHSQYSKFADVDGLRIHYLDKGEGTPVVLIHGYTSSTYTWKDEFDELAKRYRVIAIDLKGFGFSAKPDGDYSRRAQGELVARFLRGLNVEGAWLVGNSMGGETALNVAVDHPEMVSGLVLIDSAGIKVAGRTSLAPWYLQLPVVGRLLTALALTSDSLVRAGLEKSFYDDSKISDERVAAYYQPLKTQGGQLSATRARAQFELLPVEDRIDSIKVPTLIIWGAEDELIPLEAGRKLNELIGGSKLVVFEECGHVPQEEMPERVLSEIIGFVK